MLILALGNPCKVDSDSIKLFKSQHLTFRPNIVTLIVAVSVSNLIMIFPDCVQNQELGSQY